MMREEFNRTAGLAAILAGVVGFLYAVSFVILKNAVLSSVFLMLGGLLTITTLAALFRLLEDVDNGAARLGLLLGSLGALGSAIHGSYDLANAINPPATVPAGLDAFPSQIDPRGFLTFAVAGLAVFLAASLMGRSSRFPRGLSTLGYVLAALLVVVYLARLIVLSASSPLVLGPAALTGFIVNPAWYIWLGLTLRQEAVGSYRREPA